MKKILSIILALIVTFSIIGCSSPKTKETKAENEKTETDSSTKSNENKVDLSGDISGEINVSVYDSMMYKQFLDEAKLKFEAKYPNTLINVNSFSKAPEMKTSTDADGNQVTMIMSDDDPQAAADYINKVNTEIMSGKGADIYAMDVLPIHKYAQSGQLENLDDYINSDNQFNKSDYRNNIIDATKFNGNQYVMPVEYMFDYLTYDKSILNESAAALMSKEKAFTYDDLVNIGKDSFNALSKSGSPTKMFESFDPYYFFQKVFAADYEYYVDVEKKTANFLDGKFVELLNKFKAYEEQGYINAATNQSEDTVKVNFEQSDEKFFFKNKNSFLLLNEIYKNPDLMMMSAGGSTNDNDVISGMIKNDNNEITADINHSYGINSASNNKKLSWEFIKFLVSEEMQSSPIVSGNPVLISAFNNKATDLITGEFYQKMNPEYIKPETAPQLNEEQQKGLDEYLAAMNDLSDKINICFSQDKIINDIIYKEANNFIDGTKTADDAAKFIQNKVELYLSE